MTSKTPPTRPPPQPKPSRPYIVGDSALPRTNMTIPPPPKPAAPSPPKKGK